MLEIKKRTRQADLNTLATALSESVADALEEDDLKRVELLVQRYGKPEAVTLRIFASDGRLLATSSPQVDRQTVDWSTVEGIEEALQNQPTQRLAKGVLSNDDRLYVAQPMFRKILGIRLDVPPVQLQGDPERLLQAFLNVLDNAIKHSPPDAEVCVTGKVAAAEVIVKIQDRGSGIDQSDLPHVFEQFYTGDRSRKGSGTGLGLAIA